MNFLWWIIIGLVAGWAAGKIMKGSGYGLWVNLLLGVAGAILGGYLTSLIGLGGGGLIYTLLVAIAGAVLILYLFSLFTKK
jgi:uncharacterized membrane protein YeaQ/YmgE (transglycosylase-associated protein family)